MCKRVLVLNSGSVVARDTQSFLGAFQGTQTQTHTHTK